MLSGILALALGAADPGAPLEGGAENPPPPAAAVDSDQLLLFAVQLDNATLSESLTAYGDPEDPLIPIGELSRLLDLQIDVRPAEKLATGRLGESQRPITIDLAAGKALIGGRQVDLIPPDSKITGTDIYLRASLVAKLLPVSIRSTSAEMLLDLTAREKLPVQARKERTGRLAGLMDAPEAADSALDVPTPYRWFSRPSLDVGLELGYDSATKKPITRAEGRISGDLLQMGVTAWMSTDERGNPSSARLTATRRNPEGGLLGPLDATSFAAGDVYAPAMPLGARSSGGAGFVISTARQQETSVFQRIDLRGELPIGYDVELYVNDILRSGQQGAKIQGRYEFTDVALVRGRNVIRVVLYGPRGERSEQTRVINVGGGQLAAGQTVIEAGVVAQDRSLLSLSPDDQLPGNLAHGSLRAVATISHGLSTGVTASAGFATYKDMNGARHEVLTAGIRTSLLGMAVQGDFAKDLRGGSALSLGAAGRVGGIGFLARHVEYSGAFNDEANHAWDAGRPMRRYDELTADFALPLPGKARLPISANIERVQFADGGTTFSARARTTASVAGTLVGLGTDYQRQTSPGGSKTESFTGNVSFSRFIDYKWQLRANMDYRFKPKFELETLGISADRAINDRYSLRLGASRSFASKDVTLQAGVTARLPFADATLGGDYSTSQKRWKVGVQFNFGLVHDPFRGGYRMTPPGPANGGSAAMRAWIDANDNGRPDAGEAPVSGIELLGAGHKVVTDAKGLAFVTGLGESAQTTLRTDAANADTPFFASPPQHVRFASRAGNVAPILYPLVPTSELVVRLSLRQTDGALTGLSAVRVRMVPEKGGAAIMANTEFDGVAVFDAVKPGVWRLELDPEQAVRLGMKLAGPARVVIGADGGGKALASEILFVRNMP